MREKISENLQNIHEKYPETCGQIYCIQMSITNSMFALTAKLLGQRHAPCYSNYYCASACAQTFYIIGRKYDIPFYLGNRFDLQSKLFARSITGAGFFTTISVASYLLPIQMVGVLIATNILWGQLFDALIGRFKIGLKMLVLAQVTFLGIVLVVNPALILEPFGVDYSGQGDQAFTQDFFYYLGVFIGLLGAITIVCNNFLLGGIASETHFLQPSFYAMCGLVMCSAVIILFSEKDGPWLLVDFITAFIYYLAILLNQLLIFLMNRYEKRQTVLSIITNFQVIWNFILAIVVYHSTIFMSNVIGAQQVVLCGVLIIKSKQTLQEETKKNDMLEKLAEKTDLNLK